MAIYTRRGDRGLTSLYDSQNAQNRRIPKSSKLITAIGAVDEVNSYLGLVVAKVKDGKLKGKINSLQSDLFTVGAVLAGAKTSSSGFRVGITSERIKELEREIDDIESTLPVLTNFILPGGDEVGAHLHYARSLTRRAERALVALPKNLMVPSVTNILPFINRLSDYLFTLARKVNSEARMEDLVWRSGG